MEKAVSKILQTFMIHEQSGRGRNGTKQALRSSDCGDTSDLETRSTDTVIA
jgi:hypothetical protein